MEYRIEAIGASFTNKDITNLGNRFSQYGKTGWELHSVFQAQQPGCLGIGTPTITYFAIYINKQ